MGALLWTFDGVGGEGPEAPHGRTLSHAVPPGDWRATCLWIQDVDGAKVADCARTTRCGEVHSEPCSSRPWESPGWSTALPSREFCWESPTVRPVHGSEQLLERGFSGGEGSRGFPPADWHGGCYLHPHVAYSIRAGRPYGFLTEPGGKGSVRGQREGGCGVPVPALHAGREGQSPRHSLREGIALMLSAAPPVALGEHEAWNTS